MTQMHETRPFGAAGPWNSSLHCEPDDPENIQHRPARQAQNALRLRLLATRLYALGPKPLFHFLDEVERGANLRDYLEEYSRLLADFVKAYEPQGIHRTALSRHGAAIKRAGKTLRMSLGAVKGGAIKLDPDEDVTQGLCIGEGVETCLAGRQMGLRPVGSVLSSGGIAGFPLLSASKLSTFFARMTQT